MDRDDRDHAIRRPETAFPLADTQYRKLYLDASDGSPHDQPSTAAAFATYDAQTGQAAFDLTFDHDTELTGFFKLRLWVEARAPTTWTCSSRSRKPDRRHHGAHPRDRPAAPRRPGLLRVSHRQLDQSLSTEAEPVQANDSEQRLTPGDIVPVEIPIWPTSRFLHAGERLRVVVSGHYVRQPGWIEPFAWDTRNDGEHIIHTGGTYDSHLLTPQIPQVRPVIPGDSTTAANLDQMPKLGH